MVKKDTKLNFGKISTEDDLIDLDDMHEAQAAAGPAHLKHKRVLLLNADFQPLNYKPLSTIPWTKAFFWLTKGWNRMTEGKEPIITVVEEYDSIVRSGHEQFKVPSVVALTKMAYMPKYAPFTRGNVYLRDDYTCQYTGVKYNASELTWDHVYPQSRGGKTNWYNIVSCHKDVNFKKADKTPEEAGLKLIKKPHAPTAWELREKGKSYPSKFDHESWADYVYFNVKLDQSM